MKKHLRWILPAAFYIALVGFLAVYVATVDWSVLADLELVWLPLIAATLISLGFRYWGVGIWFLILKRIGATGLRGHYRELTYIYAKSWLGRYIPGAATWILGKIYFASRHGVSKSRLAVSGLLEGAMQILATLLIGSLLILWDARTQALPLGLRVGVGVVLIAGLIGIIPPIFNRVLAVAARVIRRGPLDPDALPGWRTMGEGVGLYIVGALLTGTSYFLVAASVYPEIDIADAPFIIGAASLSSAISMIVVFAPGGLGVREGVLGLLLAVVMPGPIALVLVVLLRLWSVVVDLLFYAITWLSRPRRTELTPDPEPEPVE